VWEYIPPLILYWEFQLSWLRFSGEPGDFLSKTGADAQSSAPRAPIYFDLALAMLDPGTILSLVQYVGSAAKRVCDAIDKAQELDQVVKSALLDLRQGIDSLKSDTMVYKVLITAMQEDTNPTGLSIFAIFIKKYVWSAWVTPFILTADGLKFQTGWT